MILDRSMDNFIIVIGRKIAFMVIGVYILVDLVMGVYVSFNYFYFFNENEERVSWLRKNKVSC